ncbi:MAG: class IV adenylate cyclase [Candidatus Nanohaloarchaeota archaeon QJJ-9]|nr:class IV adenylate cyclase [Candidatus Nanohaloarchaeota archaeon QJJ-9]
MPRKEVEVKVQVDEEEVEETKKKIKELGGEKIEEIVEKDLYFTSPVRDFMETNECLRIRRRPDYKELTYKGKSNEAMKEKDQFWKSELDIPIEDVEKVRSLLVSIGCKELVDVVKHRQKFELEGKEITLDKVNSVGWFLEVESEVEEEKVEEAVEENQELVKKLGLGGNPVVEKPYRDVVLKSE